MKKKVFFRWNNIWNISLIILLGTTIYSFIFEREFILSNESDSTFIKISMFVLYVCCLSLSRLVIVDEERVYVCNFIGMTLSVIYWKNCTKCFVGKILQTNAKHINSVTKYIIVKDANHKKIRPNSTKKDCAVIIEYSKKRKEILQKLYGKNINENLNIIYR